MSLAAFVSAKISVKWWYEFRSMQAMRAWNWRNWWVSSLFHWSHTLLLFSLSNSEERSATYSGWEQQQKSHRQVDPTLLRNCIKKMHSSMHFHLQLLLFLLGMGKKALSFISLASQVDPTLLRFVSKSAVLSFVPFALCTSILLLLHTWLGWETLKSKLIAVLI